MTFAAIAASVLLAAAPPQAASAARATAVEPVSQKARSVVYQQTIDNKLTRLEKSVADVEAQIDSLKSDVDDMSEMSELDMIRLQMAMNRLSKLEAALSNVMKKASETQSAIASNLK